MILYECICIRTISFHHAAFERANTSAVNFDAENTSRVGYASTLENASARPEKNSNRRSLKFNFIFLRDLSILACIRVLFFCVVGFSSKKMSYKSYACSEFAAVIPINYYGWRILLSFIYSTFYPIFLMTGNFTAVFVYYNNTVQLSL